MEQTESDFQGNGKEAIKRQKRDKNDNIADPKQNKANDSRINIFFLICIVGISLGIILEIINASNRNRRSDQSAVKPKYWVYSAVSDVENRNGLLKHVYLVLDRLGYEKGTNETDWNLLWSHDYPFRVLYPNLHRLKPHQRVNKFPGIGYITTKVNFATTESKYIPKAFKLPGDKDTFLKYAKENKNSVFVEKHNHHREVYLKNVTEINLSGDQSFVQEYVQKPFLVDGHKFDIGVYVVITSVNPLRAYWYKGDVLFRYCPAKYYPFDPKVLDKYVVADDYLPTWEVPSLAHAYTAFGYSMKDSFDIYARSKGKDPSKMWDEVQNAIAEVLLMKEKHIIEALQHYPSSENFFELMRFDLVIDEDMKVYLLEANMSPNLSSAHYPPNQLLYEQVLYNVFSLTGVGRIVEPTSSEFSEKTATQTMVSTQKNIAVWGNVCTTKCKDQCVDHICGVCKTCMSGRFRESVLKAHREYLHRGDFRRLFPPVMTPNAAKEDLKNMNEMNKLQYQWYQGKCNIDVTWCT